MAEYKEIELYKGKVRVRFYEESHKYYASYDGAPFRQKPGCTTITGIKDKSKALEGWNQQIVADFLLKLLAEGRVLDHELALEAAVQNEILKTGAADIGKEAHEYCEAFIKHELGVKGFEHLPDMPERQEAITGVNAFLDWWGGNKIEPIVSEQVVYWRGKLHKDDEEEVEFIGTLDLDAKVNGKRAIVDFKTSNGLYNGVRLQTRGYQLAREAELGKPVYKERWAIRLSKFSEEEYYKKEERKKELRRLVYAKKGWEVKEYPIKPYQVFEAKLLDDKPGNMAQDLRGFMAALELYKWDGATDFFRNGN